MVLPSYISHHNSGAPALGFYGNRITWRCRQNSLISNPSSCNLTSYNSKSFYFRLQQTVERHGGRITCQCLQSVLVSIRCPRECCLSTEGGRSHYGRAVLSTQSTDIARALDHRPNLFIINNHHHYDYNHYGRAVLSTQSTDISRRPGQRALNAPNYLIS